MIYRPYFKVSTQELEHRMLASWSDVSVLQRIDFELSNRPSSKARVLRDQVQFRLCELNAAPRLEGTKSPSDIQKLRLRIEELEQEVKAAMRRSAQLEDRNRELQKERDMLARANDPLTRDLYAQVGLSPTCPDFVLEAARRILLKRLHPDSLGAASADAKKRAEEKFKQIFSVFEQIEKLRAVKSARK